MAFSNRPRLLARQAGVTAVELALISIALFTMLFGVIELSRLAFLWGTYSQATVSAVRGAAIVNISANKDAIRQRALLVNGDKPLFFSGGTTYRHLHIDYLNANGDAVPTLPCSAENVVVCMNNPNDASCIRFVRARLCQPDTDCDNVPYEPLLPLGGIALLKFPLPTFSAIAPIEAAGMPNACT